MPFGVCKVPFGIAAAKIAIFFYPANALRRKMKTGSALKKDY
jgi:hypothetical protein